jgi:phosphatidylserine/phosphatidylglycerophosphate/cardiolipin synthase-like enzyme
VCFFCLTAFQMLRSVAFDRQCFEQLADFVSGAQRWVLMSVFEFAPDAGNQVVDALNETAARGCDVCLVVNNWRAGRNSNRCSKSLRHALVPEVQLRLWRHWLISNTHGKFAVRDDGRLLVLSSNLTHQFLKCRWRGVGIVLEDHSAAEEVCRAFRFLWDHAKPQRTTCQGFRQPRIQQTRELAVPTPELEVVWQTHCASCYSDRADAPPVRTLWHMIETSKRTIDIVTPNLSSRSVLKRLVAAQQRGVEVRCVLSRGMNTFYKYIGHLTNEQVADRYSFNIRWANSSDVKCQVSAGCHRSKQPYDINHTKLLVVDGTRVLFGSTNLDFISLQHAAELNVAFDDPQRFIENKVFRRFWLYSHQ